MPLYRYECDICDGVVDAYNTVEQRHNAINCDCGQPMSLKIMPANIQPVLGGGDFPGYQCVVMDEYVTSRKRRKYIMESNNLIEVGDRKPTGKRLEAIEQAAEQH